MPPCMWSLIWQWNIQVPGSSGRMSAVSICRVPRVLVLYLGLFDFAFFFFIFMPGAAPYVFQGAGFEFAPDYQLSLK
jgi:hypothetical protein